MISFIIPTLNSERTLEACLRAIQSQDLPRDRYETVVADAGSTDRTLDIARGCGVDMIVPNPLRTGEAGKSAGIRASTGDLIALVDSDNILPDPDWLARMTAPFENPDIVASEPISYTVRSGDPDLTRYFALLGMNDPICLFTGNYDRLSAVTGTWTGLDVPQQDRGDYLELELTEEALPTIGANGFVFRRSLLEHVDWDPYFFDIDVVHQAVRAGLNRVAKVKTGIVHLYCARLSDFARKQRRRIRDFLYFTGENRRTYPWARQRRLGIVGFALATLFVLPVLVQAIRGYARHPDRAWRYHVPVCWITLWIYGLATLRKVLGLKQAPVARDTWQETGRA
jgi:glycosyltransferase involved in cell wall biosynthesis